MTGKVWQQRGSVAARVRRRSGTHPGGERASSPAESSVLVSNGPTAGERGVDGYADTVSGHCCGAAERERTVRTAAMAGWGPTWRVRLLSPPKYTAASVTVRVLVLGVVAKLVGLEPSEMFEWLRRLGP